MTVFLIILLSLSVFMILAGHFLLSHIDRTYVYPMRLSKVQPEARVYAPSDKLPADLPPAIVSQLVFFHGHTKEKGKSYTKFTVTLLDLIHRGKIRVIRDGNMLLFLPLSTGEELLPFEKTLLNFIRDACKDSDRIYVKELKGYIEEHREKAAEMRSRFLREVTEDFLSRGFAGEVSYEKETHPLVLIGKLAVTASVGAMAGWLAGNIPLGLIAVGLAVIAATLCLQVFRYKLPYLTKEGVEMLAGWKAYGEYLAALTPETGKTLPPHRFSELAVYAAALEQTKTFSELSSLWKNLAEDYPECELYHPYFFQKLCEIDYSIRISNVRLEDAKELNKAIQKGRGKRL